MQIKDLQIKLAQKTSEAEKFKSKSFDLQEDKKKILAQNKDLKVDLDKKI